MAIQVTANVELGATQNPVKHELHASKAAIAVEGDEMGAKIALGRARSSDPATAIKKAWPERSEKDGALARSLRFLGGSDQLTERGGARG